MSVLRVGILGPGRARNGLGPYLARWLESHRVGARVVAVAGRDRGRTRDSADGMAAEFGHPVSARIGIDGLLAANDLDAVVIASPPKTHLVALEATLAAGLPTLCEKPLVPVAATDRAVDLCAGFARAGVLLMENCQWPETLGAFATLHPGWDPAKPPDRFAMRLSPSHRGRAMLEDSLSHFLSLVQAVSDPVPRTDSGSGLAVERVAFSAKPTDDCGSLDVDVEWSGSKVRTACLELRYCQAQPRPAWYAFAALRLDREIDLPDYRMIARFEDRRISMDDPLAALVYRFAQAVREPHHERIQCDAERIRRRALLFRDIVSAW